MNATDVDMRKVNRLEVIDEDGRSYVNWQAKALGIELSLQDDGRTIKVFTKGRSNVAAAKEEAERKVEPVAWMLDDGLTVETERRDYHDGPEWTPLYLASTTGIDVEGVMKIVEREVLTHQRISETLRGIRKALEAHAEKGGDNLRKG